MKNDEEPPTERKRLRTKWLEPNTDRKRRSNKNEHRLAKKLVGGKRIKQSGGALWSPRERGSGTRTTEGGDVKTADFHLENKRTDKKSMSVQREWLNAVKAAAKRVMKEPGVILTFEGKLQAPEDWVMVPIEVFERLRNKDR
jgi:hypothetical protein